LKEFPDNYTRLSLDGMIVPHNTSQKEEAFEVVIRRMTDEYSNKPAGTAGAASTMLPLLVKGDGTWEKLQILQKTINATPQGPSLAAYRAYLLASSSTSSSVTTRFCDDANVGKIVTEVPAWATLNSLYFDGYEMASEELRNRNKEEWKRDMAEIQTKIGYSPGSTVPVSFEGYTFQSLVDKAIDTNLCGEISNATGASILKAAHMQLRGLYDTHLQWVAGFMARFVDLTTVDGRKVVRFNEKFMSPNPDQTVQDTIELYIKAARKMLLKHYVAVEEVYTTAIRRLKRTMAPTVVAAAGAAAAAAATTTTATV